MNYQEKAWLMHRGKPLVRHVLDRIEPQVDGIVISRNRMDPRYADLPWPCMADTESEADDNFRGPLAGVLACQAQVASPLTLVVPCDMPQLPLDLVARLGKKIADCDVVIAADDAQEQPLVQLARTEVLASIQDYLDQGQRSVKGWLERLKVSREVFQGNALENINNLSQLQTSRRPDG